MQRAAWREALGATRDTWGAPGAYVGMPATAADTVAGRLRDTLS